MKKLLYILLFVSLGVKAQTITGPNDKAPLRTAIGGLGTNTQPSTGQVPVATSPTVYTPTTPTGTGTPVFSASPALTGIPTAPTAAAATNTTQIATAALVFAERTNTATLTNKSLTSPTLTGTPVAPTPASNINTTQVVNGAWVNTYYSPITGGSGYIQNQSASPQTASFNITGSGTIGGNNIVTGEGRFGGQINSAAALILGDNTTSTSTGNNYSSVQNSTLIFNRYYYNASSLLGHGFSYLKDGTGTITWGKLQGTEPTDGILRIKGTLRADLAPVAATDVVRLTDLNSLTDNVLSKTANYTVTTADYVAGKKTTLDLYVDATAGNVTITIPTAAVLSGYTLYVTKTDASANTVTMSSASSIFGGAVLSTQYQSKQFNSNGTAIYNH